MLQLIAHIILISATCIIWGIPCYLAARNRVSEAYWMNDRANLPVFLFFSGLLTISFVSSILAIFAPVKFIVLAIATTLPAAILINSLRRNLKKLSEIFRPVKVSTGSIILFISTVVLLLICGTVPTANDDTQLYHLQIIRWLNEYGIVPGTANLYPRLGLGSNWFSTISIFHIPAWKNQNFTFLNCTVTLWFFAWLINRIRFFSRKDENSSARIFALFNFLLLVYFLGDWQLFRDTANSTSYDFIVTILVVFCLSYLTESALSDQKGTFSYIFIILCFLVISFKLSGILILAPTAFYLLRFRSARIWLNSALLFLLILTPVLIKNYLVTGYPLYPSSLSAGSPQWQVPAEMVHRFRDYILNANRYYNHPLPFIESVHKTSFNWIPFWIKGITFQHKLLLAAACSSLLLFFWNGLPTPNSNKLKGLVLAVLLMGAVWFFSAPDPRFGFGFITFLAFLPVSLWLGEFISSKYYSPAMLLVSFAVIFYISGKIKPLIREPQHLVYPFPAGTASYLTREVNGIDFHFSQNDGSYWNNRCYYLPLPCLCEPNPFVKPIGTRIRQGFKLNQPDSTFIKNFNY